MKTANDIITKKSHDIISVQEDTPIFEALKIMLEKKIGVILVKNGNKISGIWSERDLIRNIVKDEADLKATKISKAMRQNLMWVEPDATLYEIMDKMITNKIRHLLVKKGEDYIGLISIGDVITHELKDKGYKQQGIQEMQPSFGINNGADSSLTLEQRFKYEPEKNLFYVNFKDFTVNSKSDVGKIEFMVASELSGVGKKVHALVNYENFYINSEIVEDYTCMVNRLMEHFYQDVTRYTTSQSIHSQLESALKKANVVPNIFDSSEEAEKVLRTLL
ncbi:CBS domain-containing protein [Desulforegula conservatrix]|uniref:CBS domain-containing protein n=1 Tax=Desulforegula conservatrix TaxID=153026 RepID=UPI000420069D|nr:CBS domain-containing protein [Desulforegula conservatrix]